MGRIFLFLSENVVGFVFVIINSVISKQKCSVISTPNAAETKQSAVFHFKTLEIATSL